MTEQATLANNGLRDLANPADAGWIKVVRGSKSFARIRNILQDRNKVLVSRPDDFFFDSTGILHSALKGMSQVVSPFSDDNIPGTIQ